MQSPLKTFIIYARSDEEHKLRLLLHLSPLVDSRLLTVWHDGDILPGEDWEKAIKKELETSELVIVLVSVHSLKSDFIRTEELRTALSRLDAGLTRVVPVVVSPVIWELDPVIKKMNVLPRGGVEGVLSIDEWPDKNRAWVTVVKQISEMAQGIHDKREAAEQAKLAEKQRLADEQTAREHEAEAQRQAKIREREEADRGARTEAEQRIVAEKRRLSDQQAARKKVSEAEIRAREEEDRRARIVAEQRNLGKKKRQGPFPGREPFADGAERKREKTSLIIENISVIFALVLMLGLGGWGLVFVAEGFGEYLIFSILILGALTWLKAWFDEL